MRFLNIHGKTVNKSITPYLVVWDAKTRSIIQSKIKKFLRKYWQNHVCVEEFTIPGCRLSIDIINFSTRIAIEVQGDQHTSFNKFFHGNKFNYLSQIKRDDKKRRWCEMNKLELVEIFESEVDQVSYEWMVEKYNIKL